MLWKDITNIDEANADSDKMEATNICAKAQMP